MAHLTRPVLRNTRGRRVKHSRGGHNDHTADMMRIRLIHEAVDAEPWNERELCRIALTPRGLMNDAMRRMVWPRFLRVDTHAPYEYDEARALAHPDHQQIELDVARSFTHFAMRKGAKEERKRQLSRILHMTLVQNPGLHYYQGLHDIVTVFLLITESEAAAFHLTQRLARFSIRFALSYNLDITIAVLRLLFVLVEHEDAELHAFLAESGVEPFFALSWVLTWFSHSLHSLHQVARLFDAFLCSHPLLPLYVSACVVVHMRERILATPCEFCEVHRTLSTLPPRFPVEQVLQHALRLCESVPPAELLARAPHGSVPKWSGLGTWPYRWLTDARVRADKDRTTHTHKLLPGADKKRRRMYALLADKGGSVNLLPESGYGRVLLLSALSGVMVVLSALIGAELG